MAALGREMPEADDFEVRLHEAEEDQGRAEAEVAANKEFFRDALMQTLSRRD